MKLQLCLLLACAAFGFAACGGDKPEPAKTEAKPAATPAKPAAAKPGAQAANAPAQKPAAAPANAAAQKPAPSAAAPEALDAQDIQKLASAIPTQDDLDVQVEQFVTEQNADQLLQKLQKELEPAAAPAK